MNVWAKVSVASCLMIVPRLSAQVQEPRNHLYDRLQFPISVTQVWLWSNVRVDRSDGTPGTEFSADDVGAANHTWEPRLALRWRPGHRHELELGYLFARTSGSRVLADTIHFADTSFARGLEVSSALKSDQASLVYRYAFHAAEQSQIGLALGLGALFVNVDLSANTSFGPVSASKAVTGPTGSAGFYGRWRLGDRWYVEGDARGLYAKIERISATVYEAGAAGRYFISRRAGFELGYGLTWIALTLEHRANEKGLAGKLKYSLQSARLAIVLTP